MICRSLLAFISCLLLWSGAAAQQSPTFKFLRYDEDYAYLKGDTLKGYEKIKFIPLGKQLKSYFSVGGELRLQYFYNHHEDWGEAPKDKDGYTLSRYLLHADLHSGRLFRAFIQLQSSMASGRLSPSPVEANPLGLHQAFIDLYPIHGEKARLTLRLGRQELMYGSQRLVSVREAPNNRQSFDGARGIFELKTARAEAFYADYVQVREGIFDDKWLNQDTRLWGLYLTKKDLPMIENIDVYYFGLSKKGARYNDALGTEWRHSLGARVFGAKKHLKYDLEGLYQFGDIADKTIAAWTASMNTSYQLSHLRLQPEIGLKAELISGDSHKNDQRLGTFNPLFPKGAYFGLAALIGPANLTDLHPSLSLKLYPNLSFVTDFDMFWRYSKKDGIYAVNMRPIYGDMASDEKYIGDQLTGALIFTPTPFLYFRAECTYFQAGSYLKEVGPGKDILFTGLTAQLKF